MIHGEKPPSLPKAIGPYALAVEAGDFLFLSGQIPVVPETGELLKGEIEDQVRRVMENIRAILESRGLTFRQIVKTTLFLKDLSDFDRVNRVYGEFFPSDPPARSTVQAARLPKDAPVEIEVIAWGGKVNPIKGESYKR